MNPTSSAPSPPRSEPLSASTSRSDPYFSLTSGRDQRLARLAPIPEEGVIALFRSVFRKGGNE